MTICVDAALRHAYQVKDWVKELHAIVGAGIILVIAGNKADLERSRVVRLETAEA